MASNPMARQISLSGVILEQNGHSYILTPAGKIDLDDMNQTNSTETPRIPRSRSILVALSQSGDMLLSPAGDIDIAKYLQQPSTKSPLIRVSSKDGETLVVSRDGHIEKRKSNSSPPPSPVPLLRRQSSLLIKTRGGKLEVDAPQQIDPENFNKKEVVISPMDDGNIILSPAGSLIAPSAVKHCISQAEAIKRWWLTGNN